MPGQLKKAIEALNGLDAVVECDRITGEDCFIAKAHKCSVEELEAVIDRLIPYAMTNSAIIQSSPVERRLPPLPRPVGRRDGAFVNERPVGRYVTETTLKV